ncbi:MAG TPA: hypothetical protein G4O12_00170 [Dehalococcoidia bacterium]|nr:hypothetical protein [Dehalococcoidia bacterium]
MDELGLDYLFHPRSIAIAGVSGDSTKFSPGQGFMQSLIDTGFEGKIYPVNPKGGEVSGSKIYPSVRDIPDRVDYVISAIPAPYTPQLVADCAAKGVRAIHFFTSGFSEIEDEEGQQLESEVLRVARQSGIRIIGPNCMGLYCPKTGLSFAVNFPEQSGFPKQNGPVGLIAQSGGNSIYCIREATTRGIYFSKVISYGNASDLNETDFLEYFTCDPETQIIALYIEGLKGGSRFATVLRRAAKVKPVIIFKAGTTESGTRAAASHTSAIAGSNIIWESFLKQAGAIQVHSVEEIVDIALLFLRMSPPKGRNTAIIGSGGGASVQSADDCLNAGLTLPVLPAQIRRKLKEIYGTEAGHIFGNPVDTLARPEMLLNTSRIIADCDQIDLLIIHVAFDTWGVIDGKDVIKPSIESLINLNNTLSKPMAVVLHSYATDEAKRLASEVHVRLREAGFPVYPSISRAASAINKFIQYQQWHQQS